MSQSVKTGPGRSLGPPLHFSVNTSAEQLDLIGKKLLTPKNGAQDDSTLQLSTTSNSKKFDFPDVNNELHEDRANFYYRHASLENHRMRQAGGGGIGITLTAVHTDLDESFGLNSPATKAKTKNTLRRLRSRTMPEMEESAGQVRGLFDSDSDEDNAQVVRTYSGIHIPKRQLRSEMQAVNVDDAVREVQLSPRSKYINACLSEGMNARASLVLKRGKAHATLKLAHQGLGDRMAVLFAHSIEEMTDVQTVELSDNNLTDEGFPQVISSLACLQALTQLDFSDNAAGLGAAGALARYMVAPSCGLRKLSLHNCGVDDDFMVTFMEGVFASPVVSSLIDLNLSNNKLGKSESIHASNQSGVLLSRWLAREDCGLQSLNISWNMIRLDSAYNIGFSLRENKSLLSLNLSYNALGREGGLEIGAALLYNSTLRRLLLEHNALDSISTITLCAGVIENQGIEEIVFDGNPIGSKGADAIMMIPLILAGRVKVSAEQCNLKVKDQSCWFDFDKLPAKYMLKMEDHFERAVALLLLHLVAAHHTIVLQKLEYDPVNNFEVVVKAAENSEAEWIGATGKKKAAKKVIVSTVETVSLEAIKISRESIFDSRQAAVAEKMRQMISASGDTTGAIRLFEDADLDHSGGIDKEELNVLMLSLGIQLTDYRLRETMSKYDTDGTGFVEIGEFLQFLAEVNAEYSEHLDDLVNIPALVERTSASEIGKRVRWAPPTTGTLKMEVVDGFVMKTVFRTIASCDRHYLESVAKKTPDAEAMLTSTLKLTKIRFDDAVTICTKMTKGHRSATSTLTKLLRQMSTVEHAREILANVIGGDRTDMAKCKREIGQYLKPIVGRPNGFYNLDLARESDRACVLALYGLSETSNHQKAKKSPFGYGFTGDTSQKGNWSSFRNELYNGAPFVLDVHFVNNLPVSGRLQFDFSSVDRPTHDDLVMQDAYLVKFLCQLGLLQASEIEETIAQLVHVKNLSNSTLKGNGKTLFEVPYAAALEMDIHHAHFYEHLGGRSEYMAKAARLEDRLLNAPPIASTVAVEKFERGKSASRGGKTSSRPTSTVKGADKRLPVINTINAMAEEEGFPGAIPLTLQPLTELLHHRPGADVDNGAPSPVAPDEHLWNDSTISFANFLEAEDEAAGVEADDISSDESVEEEVREVKEFLKDEEFTQGKEKYGVRSRHNTEMISYVRELVFGDNASNEAKLKRLVDIVEETIGSFRSMHCRHIALILACIEKLPFGLSDRTTYSGNYRVEVVIALFTHIVDMHNFELVLRVLKPYEVACINARIGMLNYFNPLKCEGGYGLDLSRWDQRMMCKMLILLETHEPGENWAEKQFRWTIDSAPFPGWVLTQAWLTEEGLPRRGILDLSYYSGEGRKRHGCIALPKFRKSLLYLTNIEEHEIVEEEHRYHSSVGASKHGSMSSISTANYDVGLNAIKLEIELWQTYLIRETTGSGVEAVTAPRKVKKSPVLEDNNYASIPVFKSQNNSKAAVVEGSEYVLPVAGSAKHASAPEKQNATSHFIAKLNESKEVPNSADAPLAELLFNNSGSGSGSAKIGDGGGLMSPSLMPTLNESLTPTKTGKKPYRNRSAAASSSTTALPEKKTSASPYRNRSYGQKGGEAVSSSTTALPEKKTSASPYRNRSYGQKGGEAVSSSTTALPGSNIVAAPPKVKQDGTKNKFRNRSMGAAAESAETKKVSKEPLPLAATPMRAAKLGSFEAPFSPDGNISFSGTNSGGSGGIDDVERARRATLNKLGLLDGLGDSASPADGKSLVHAPEAIGPVIVTSRTPFDPKRKLSVAPDQPTEPAAELHAPSNIAPVVVDLHKSPEKSIRADQRIAKPTPSNPVLHAPMDIADHAVIDPHAHAPPVHQKSFHSPSPVVIAVAPEGGELHAPKDIDAHAVVDRHAKKPYRNKSYAIGASNVSPAVSAPEAGELHAPKDIDAHVVKDSHSKAPYRNKTGATRSYLSGTKSSNAATDK